MADSYFPLRRPLPERTALDEPTGTPAQQAFRQAIGAVEELRKQLHSLRTAQATTRQAYWRQVGPLAAATVIARRALYAPLEKALLDGYLNRAEMQQATGLLVHPRSYVVAQVRRTLWQLWRTVARVRWRRAQ